MLKRIFKSEAVRAAACWLGYHYIRLVWLTGRWQVENTEVPRAFWAEGKPFILVFWHGHFLMMPKCWDLSKPMHMLASQHRDGRLITRVIHRFGLSTIAGSTTRGGSAALRQMLKALKKGEYVAVTPDGPRGPRMRATAGIVNMARLSGAPVVPCACSGNPRKVLGTWDRFQLILPFARGLIRWGTPIEVPKALDEAGIEAKRREVEAALIALSQDTEAAVGNPATAPAPPGPPPVKERRTASAPEGQA